MSRIFLQYLLPLLLPALIFVLYVFMTRYRNAQGEDLETRLRQGPWFWLSVAGFTLMFAGLGFLAFYQGHDVGGDYQPQRYEGGRIVPGEFK